MTRTKKPGGKAIAEQRPEAAERESGEVAEKETAATFPIVGIGASAGGLAAIEAFFKAVPAEPPSGIAFVVVQHLDPTHKSILPDLVQKYTQMHVFLVEDGMVVQPNCVYIIPPNHDLAFLHGHLHLIEPSAPRGLRLPIDFFFRSLADDQHERAICIVLSGTGTDGTLGLRAIKGEGGMAIVQNPDSAAYDGMPRSAIATRLVDFILPPEQMPEQLRQYVSHVFGHAHLPLAPGFPEAGDFLQRIFIALRMQTGHDFSQYKHNMIQRRVERRMAVTTIDRIEDYVKFLQKTPLEAETLFRELLIGVTSFFRDPEAFAAVQAQVIPQICAGKSPGTIIRVWVAGCSTGEEAYSLAMLLQEYLEEQKLPLKVQIFATDIDNEAVGRARSGVYPDSIAADVSPERLARFFTLEGATYRVRKSIRDLVVFAKQDILKDPPFFKLDLLSCRNLLIYLSSDLQKRLFPLFHHALNQNGALLLGTSESIGNFGESFGVVDKKWKVYRRKGAANQRAPLAPLLASPFRSRPVEPQTSIGISKSMVSARAIVEKALIEEYAPASVLINSDYDVLYVQGSTGRYLEPATGDANMNLLRMAREGLRQELTTGVRRAMAQLETVRYTNVKVKINGEITRVNLVVKPVIEDDVARGLLLITFEDVVSETHSLPANRLPVADSEQRIADLEREVSAKEEYLKTTIEELETSNEELKYTNEEVQSANEELQSTNEEMETSKEELQSVNEELLTVNIELHEKIDELSRANNDMINLMAGTGIGTIFVDFHLRIQRFTPAATQIINLIKTDIGRPVGHLASRLVGYDHLVADVRAVLDTLIPKEAEVQTTEGQFYLMRIQPYRTVENVIEGVVLTFVDVTRQTRLQEQLQELTHAAQEAQAYAESIVDTVREPLIVLDDSARVISANYAFYEFFRTTPQATIGRLLYDLDAGQWNLPELRHLLNAILPQQTVIRDFAVNGEFQAIGQRALRLNARTVRSPSGRPHLILLAIEDVSHRAPVK